MPPPRTIIEAITAPNGSIVRLIAGGAVFSDLGPAMGRTTSFPHRILANVPNFRKLVEKRMVGAREGYILPLNGVIRLLEILKDNASKTDENATALEEFRTWADDVLIPELKARFGMALPSPCKVRICAEGKMDLRFDLADLDHLLIEIEHQGGAKITIHGSALLKAKGD